MFLTPKIDQAISISAQLHHKQRRRGSDAPYIVHPFAVAFLLAHFIEDEDVICAALLHDVLEDVPEYSGEEMRSVFGERVYRIVKEVTEDRDPLEPMMGATRHDAWKARKDRYLINLENDSQEALLVACADKIHNLRSLIDLSHRMGEVMWEEFPAGKAGTQWFYQAVYEIVEERLDHPLVGEFEKALTEARQSVF